MQLDKLARRFFLRNPDGMEEGELLELLLRFSTADSAAMAQRLLAQYPTLAHLMEATPEDLLAVEGMDEETLLLLRLVPELHRRYFLARSHVEERLTESRDYGRYLLPYFYGARDEIVYLLLLDGMNRVINCRCIGHGTVNSANVPIRRMVQAALAANASGMVLAHNHPSGLAIPSSEDVELTLRLRETLELLEIDLLDHIVVADDDFVSLRESGYLHRII